MKKYLLFAGDNYYPGGGMYDLIDSFDTIEEAIIKAKEQRPYADSSGYQCYDWYHIVDKDTMNKIKEDEKIKKLLIYVKEDGVATCSVDDGRIVIFSAAKLKSLLAEIESSGKDYGIILIKDASKMN